MITSSTTAAADATTSSRLAFWLLAVQGGYFAVLGVWPIVDIRSFQAVTGPKTDHLPTGDQDDHWLVVTVGALITAIGISLLVACYTRRLSPEAAVLGILSAIVLAAIDIVFVWREVIAPIYLADAVVEILFVCCWVAAISTNREALR
jgi:hypothetical protein